MALQWESLGYIMETHLLFVFFVSSKLLHGASQRKIEAWELISTNILRKYSEPVDIWFSILYAVLLSDGLHFFLNEQPRKSYVAMAQHMSQWVWFEIFSYHFQLYFCEHT